MASTAPQPLDPGPTVDPELPSLDPAPEIIFYHEDRRLLICLECRFCLNTIDHHLRKCHQQINKSRRDIIVAFHAQRPSLGHADKGAPLSWDKPSPIEYLDIYTDAFVCQHVDCSYACLELKTYASHVSRHHRHLPRLVPGRGPVQSLFHQPNILFFQVYPMESAISPPRSFDALLETSCALHDQAEKEEAFDAMIAPSQPVVHESTPWLLRTHWPIFLAGVNMADATSLLSIPSYRTDRHPTALICRALEELLLRAHQGGTPDKCPHLIRRMLASTSADHKNSDPANFSVSLKTLTTYTRTWQSLVLYLFRARLQLTLYRLQLTPDQLTNLTAIADLVVLDNVESSELVQLLLKFSISLITQPLYGHAHESPLVHTMGVLGFNPTLKTWKLPHQYTPLLSHLLYCARILALEWCLPSSTRQERPRMVLDFQKFHTEHLTASSFSAITELISLRAYGMVIAKEHHSQERFHWSLDRQTLYFDDSILGIPALRSLAKEVLAEAQHLLTTRLVFLLPAYLDTRDARHFSDNINNTSNGWCFLDLPSNKLDNGARRVCTWLLESPMCRQMISGKDDTRRWAHAGIHSYHKTVDEFLALLFVLVHLTSGMPARGTEVASMKLRNSMSTTRNFFVHDGQVMTVTDYHKPQAITGAPMVISRWLPSVVGQLFIAFVADVHPFSSMLRLIVKSSPPKSPSIFSGTYGVWDTATLSSHLKKSTSKHLGTSLSLAAWRQVSVAIDKGFNLGFIDGDFSLLETEEGDTDASINMASAYQTGHGPTIHHRLYGQSTHLTDGAMVLTRNISARLHGFWTLQSRHGTSPTPQAEPSRLIPSATVDEAMRAIFPPSGSWRSPAQEDAVMQSQSLLLNNITVLPTSAGKSATFMVLARMYPSSVQVVVIPYQALLRDMLHRCSLAGIQAEEWTGGVNGHKQLIFVSAEAAVSDNFLRTLRHFKELGHLGRIFFDECHTLVLAKHYRETMGGLSKLAALSQGMTFLTATLPTYVEIELRESFHIEDAYLCRAHTARLKTLYAVEIRDLVLTHLLARLDHIKSQPNPGKTIVFVASIQKCEQIGSAIDAPYYHSTYPNKQLSFERWSRGLHPVIVATSALGQGIDVSNVTNVIHYENPYLTLTDYMQQSGRAGREGQPCAATIVMSRATEARLLRSPASETHIDEHVAISDYIRQTRCRRLALSTFFDAGRKDTCATLVDATYCDLCATRKAQPTIAVSSPSAEMGPPLDLPRRQSPATALPAPLPVTPVRIPHHHPLSTIQAPLKRRRESDSACPPPPPHPTFRDHTTRPVVLVAATSGPPLEPTVPAQTKAISLSSPLTQLGSTPDCPYLLPSTPLPALTPLDPISSISNSTDPSSDNSPRPFITARMYQETFSKYQDRPSVSHAKPRPPTATRPKTPPYNHAEQQGHRQLERIWHTLSLGCPLCWLAGTPNWREHNFATCSLSITIAQDIATIRAQMHFTSSVVHFSCGAPIWLCENFRSRNCSYQNITFPLVAAIIRTPKLQPLLSTLAHSEFEGYQDTTSYSRWLTRNTHRFGRPVPNALSLIQQVFLAIEGAT